MKFIIDKKIIDEFEDLKIGGIVLKDIDNSKEISFNKEMKEICENIKNNFKKMS